MSSIIRWSLSFAFLLLYACSSPSVPSSGLAEWNYLVYMAADNDLERFALDNIADMKKV